jgi:hypothetical protein
LLTNRRRVGGQPKSVLDISMPEAAKLTEKDVNKLGEPFTYKALIRTARELIAAPEAKLLLTIIPSYSELSGFVHGGPSAFEKLVSLSESGESDAQLIHVADVTVRMFYSAERWLLMLAAALDGGFQPYLTALDNGLNEADGVSNDASGVY